MKEIKYTSYFTRNYKLRITRDEQLARDFRESIEAFLEDKTLVGDHALEDVMQEKQSFSINDDYRVVYIERDEYFLFLNVGTHEQVYKRS